VRVLVTGGLGFLGHAVTVDLLDAGHHVTVLTRGRPDAKPPADADLVEGDIRDRQRMHEIVAAGEFDGVCHLAALTRGRDSFADPLTYYNVNVGGTLNLLMALDAVRGAQPPARFVFASTNIVYGSVHAGALSEAMEPHPESPYAWSKLAAEQLVSAYAATGAIGAITLRPFNIAGAIDGVGDTDTARIIPNVFRAVGGELLHVTLNGDGSIVRDFVHVGDVAAAVGSALLRTKAGACQVYNLGSGVGTQMIEIVHAVELLAGTAINVVNLPPRPEPPTMIADISRAMKGLDWQPSRSSLMQILADAWSTWTGAVARR